MDLKSLTFEGSIGGVSTKKSIMFAEKPFFFTSIVPPLAAPVYKYSQDMDAKTPAIAASKALPPSFKILLADSTVSL